MYILYMQQENYFFSLSHVENNDFIITRKKKDHRYVKMEALI